MSNTIWKNSVKEGFKEGSTVRADTNEEIISNGPPGDAPQDSSLNETLPPSLRDKLSDLFANFNMADAKQIYTDCIKSIKIGADGIKDVIAGIFSEVSPTLTDADKKTLSRQVAIWFIVLPSSYWVIINWWYVLCYTNYTIDFNNFILAFLYWPMAPALKPFQLFNYVILTSRMEAGSQTMAYIKDSLWNWRPITFSIFHAVIVSIMITFSVTDATMSGMLNDGILVKIVSALSIYYFISLFVQQEWYKKFVDSGSTIMILILIGFIVVSFIFMFYFINIICPLFTLYLLFLSYFVLLVFNKFWPPTILSICEQIFQELKEAPVVEPEPNDTFGRLKNLAFQNAHSLYLLFTVFIILTTHINAAMTFSSNSIMITAIILNFAFAGLFTSSAFTVVFDLISILVGNDLMKTDDGPVNVSETKF